MFLHGLLVFGVTVEAVRIAKRLWDARERRRRKKIECSGDSAWRRCTSTIVAIGDSITEYGALNGGWVAEIQELYSRRADVLNRGFSGYTSRIVRKILLDILATLPSTQLADVIAITVMLGVNDCGRPGDFQHVPEAEFVDNMKIILCCLRNRWPKSEVIVLSPPHVDADAWRETCRANGWGDGGGRTAERVRLYGQLAQQAARDCGCCFVDVCAAMEKAAQDGGFDLATLLDDGLHLSPSGNGVVRGAVLGALESRGRGPASVPTLFPGMPAVFEVAL